MDTESSKREVANREDIPRAPAPAASPGTVIRPLGSLRRLFHLPAWSWLHRSAILLTAVEGQGFIDGHRGSCIGLRTGLGPVLTSTSCIDYNTASK